MLYASVALLFAAGGGLYLYKYISSYDPTAIKSNTISTMPDSANQPQTKEIKLLAKDKVSTITSPVYKADFEFNALAPHWQEELPDGSSRTLYMRTSADSRGWTQWIPINTEGAVRDDEPHPEMTYIESPMFVTGRFFQYRLTLERSALDGPSPKITKLKIAYIDSRKPKLLKALQTAGSFINSKVSAADQGPRIVSRSEWGSPDPTGEALKGADNFWEARHAPVKQVFIHHTVNKNSNSDPAAIVRGIWHFHTYTRGWGDIGYNYILDQNGTIYEGRFGGDNVIAGHAYEYNTGSLGVAMIGCYDSGDSTCKQLNGSTVNGPTAAMWDSLSSLLSWKSTNFSIDPTATHSFCKYNGTGCLNLSTIAGHKDVNLTSCPGNLVYDSLATVRNEVAQKNSTLAWSYSAKQMSFDIADLSGSSDKLAVALQFQNTGSSTWNNAANRLVIKTSAPPDRNSHFYDESWINTNTPAAMAEPSVAPGATGTFNFTIKRPPLAYGYYPEYFRIMVEGVGDIRAHFTLPINVVCTIGQAVNPRENGALIRNEEDGAIYLIEAGAKRHIGSLLSLYSHGYSPNHVLDVSAAEVAALPNGVTLAIKEGTLVKGSTSPQIYVIDFDGTTHSRRWVSTHAAFETHGMKYEHVHTVSQSTVDSYTDGPAVTKDSAIPDGRLVKSNSGPAIYIIEDGKRRGIANLDIFTSYGYRYLEVGSVSQVKIDQLPQGTTIQYFRTGTVFKSADAPNIYISDIVNGIGHKRWIGDYKAYIISRHYYKPVHTLGSTALGEYQDGTQILCHR